MERAMGIEPTYGAWEAAILPLNYARSEETFLKKGFLRLLPKTLYYKPRRQSRFWWLYRSPPAPPSPRYFLNMSRLSCLIDGRAFPGRQNEQKREGEQLQ